MATSTLVRSLLLCDLLPFSILALILPLPTSIGSSLYLPCFATQHLQMKGEGNQTKTTQCGERVRTPWQGDFRLVTAHFSR
ncbi:hypothetical protein Csa_023271 [Cucumis sativus]|uniref:Uncharacterized protein n=1 Tax=Cucumis sativus TaxID=3659 RepID=A0A0A0LES1_CUCSA|nr:hypothetical protein Csa_023271 [Cucumis sativus]